MVKLVDHNYRVLSKNFTIGSLLGLYLNKQFFVIVGFSQTSATYVLWLYYSYVYTINFAWDLAHKDSGYVVNLPGQSKNPVFCYVIYRIAV